MPEEDLTAYIERRRREFESKADGGSIGIEILFQDKMANGGRAGYVSGGAALKLLEKGKEFADFYEKDLLPEVQDRVDRGIAAVANEQARVMSDTQPPWGFLSIYRYLEKWGVVSIGSLYTFGLEGMWLYDKENNDLQPRPLPEEKPQNREEACTMLADWHLYTQTR